VSKNSAKLYAVVDTNIMEAVTMAKNDQPGTTVIDSSSDERSEQREGERFWQAVDRIRERNADKDLDEVYRIVTEVVEEVRQEQYVGEQRKRPHGC
jgi:hypothetical protein